MITFETLLDGDFDWALQEADRYFAGKGFVRQTLRDLASRLDELAVDYAVIGALAMYYYGYRRFTSDVDVLVSPSGLNAINESLIGHGYERPAEWQRGFRDEATGVAVHVMVAGSVVGVASFAGHTLPEPGRFVDRIDGLNILSLPRLLELKIALGSAPHALRHMGDAQELIRYTDVPQSFADELSPRFRGKFLELWSDAQRAKADDY